MGCNNPACVLCYQPPSMSSMRNELLAALEESLARSIEAKTGLSVAELRRRRDAVIALKEEITRLTSPTPERTDFFDDLIAGLWTVLHAYARREGSPTVETPAVSMDTLVNGGRP